MQRHFLSSCLVSAAAVLGLVSVHAQAVVSSPPPATFKIETGASFSRGDYGLSEDTDVWVVPFNLVYDAPKWTVRASLPWVRIKGPATVLGDLGTGVGGPVRPTSASESGLGDSSLGFTYKLNPGPDRLNADVTARVKFPTGDDARGIGTGETDYYTQVDLYQNLGRVTPFGTIGYRWLGDGRYTLENGLYASGGVLFTIQPGTSVGVSVDWRSRLVAGGDNATESSLFLFKRMNDQWNFTLSVMKGFTDASANYGIGTQFTYAF
jgi:hypothetical protein